MNDYSTSARYPILYSFRRCPYAIRARMALARAEITCELREVLLKNKPSAFLEASDKGTVPVLQLRDNTIIDESIDVMMWALDQNDPAGWLNANQTDTWDLITQNDNEFKPQLDCYKYFERYPEKSQLQYRTEAEEFLLALDERLKLTGGGLVTARDTLADIAIFPFIRQFAHVDLAWFNQTPYTQLQQWLERLKQSGLFLSVMQKFKPWRHGDPLRLTH